MAVIIVWLLLVCWLSERSYELFMIVLLGGIVYFIYCLISVSNEEAQAKANIRRHWAHYYDNDRKGNGV